MKEIDCDSFSKDCKTGEITGKSNAEFGQTSLFFIVISWVSKNLLNCYFLAHANRSKPENASFLFLRIFEFSVIVFIGIFISRAMYEIYGLWIKDGPFMSLNQTISYVKYQSMLACLFFVLL